MLKKPKGAVSYNFTMWRYVGAYCAIWSPSVSYTNKDYGGIINLNSTASDRPTTLFYVNLQTITINLSWNMSRWTINQLPLPPNVIDIIPGLRRSRSVQTQ